MNKNIEEMCKYYGVNIETYRYNPYIKREILSGLETSNDTRCVDHLGNIFRNQKEMCDYYGISVRLYTYRIKQGWSLADTLTTPLKSKPSPDHLNNNYKHVHVFPELFKIDMGVYRKCRKNTNK